ncbi:MAG: phospho-sugar mutase [Microthrixaceae bacterium]|nr:phospho-sugar mutase [Microthrixaceae bacterium]
MRRCSLQDPHLHRVSLLCCRRSCRRPNRGTEPRWIPTCSQERLHGARSTPTRRHAPRWTPCAQQADAAELEALFTGRIEFGTAGLRGPLGVGPNRMNRLVCRQTAAGLALALADSTDDAGSRGVVLAHDARHGSAVFADDIAEVLTTHGLDVHRISGPAPTPLAAFAVRHLGAAAGVVVTASHNPAQDNGIKVYWSDGAQIVEPLDRRIAERIDRVARGEATVDVATVAGQVHDLGPVVAGTQLVEAYLKEAVTLVPAVQRMTRPLAVTSLHGVGADLLELTLARGGHGDVHHVAAQRDPDPDFPTVVFPNPEEPGSMDLVIRLAESVHADLALANDPDADRLAVAAPTPEGRWRILTGDEVGALLAAHLLALTSGVQDRLVTTTIVSSRLLSAMAEAAGVHYAETLTGFKWLCRPGLDHPEWHQVIAYEEALGYALGPTARDKDGITAALVAADMAAALHASGRSVWNVLDDLAREHGAHVTSNGSVRLEGPDATQRMLALTARLEQDPPSTGYVGGR